MSFENNNIGSRLRLIREITDLSRREVEDKSNGDIKAASLSSYENNQSQISINYIQKLVSFYSSIGIDIDYGWLITGIGDIPHEQSNIDTNVSSIKEAGFFKKENRNAIIHTIDNDELSPLIKIGYLIGGVLDKENNQKERIRLIRKFNGDIVIGNSKLIEGKMIITDKNGSISHLNMKDIESTYSIIWIRGFV